MFEKFLHQTPFFRLVIPLILGILFQINFRFTVQYNPYILFGLLLILLLFIFLKLTRSYTLNKVWGIIISLYLFSLGIELVSLKQQKEYSFENGKQTFIATLIEQPEEKENSIKTILKLDLIKDSVQWNKNDSKVLCYLEKDTFSLHLNMGDQIIANTYINKSIHTGNPYAFNYKKYLGYKEIYNQCYIQSDCYQVIGKNKGAKLKFISNKLRQKLLNIYNNNHISGDEFAVLSALTLGYKSELTPEIKESFSTSGAMHILAVSGLHVGIIYIILCKLLFFLQRIKYGKYLQSIIIIIVLFFYAFLTGLSDSVFRATIMFTFISIGKIFTRQVNIYNSIVASAFLLLLMNPYAIMNVGFQLSFAAVLSIVFFQPKLYSLLNINNSIIDYFWQLVSVSIAAQIGTFPITMFYFGQFPVYFMLTNIIVIPAVTIIIYGAFILFILSFSDFLSEMISLLLNYITSFLNHIIHFIENLPHSTIDQILVTGNESIILIAFILVIAFFIITKRLTYLRISFFLLIINTLYNLSYSYVNSQKKIFVVHHLQKMTGVQIIKNKKATLLTNMEIDQEEKDIQYNIEPLWRKMEIKKLDIAHKYLENAINYFSFNDKKIIQIQYDSLALYESKNRLNVDYVILSNNVNLSINKIKQFFNFDLIIFDSSNDFYKVKDWEKDCLKNNIAYYNVLDKGAYIESL